MTSVLQPPRHGKINLPWYNRFKTAYDRAHGPSGRGQMESRYSLAVQLYAEGWEAVRAGRVAAARLNNEQEESAA